MEEEKGRQHAVCLRTERSRISAKGAATSGNKDGVGSGDEAAKRAALWTSAAIGSELERSRMEEVDALSNGKNKGDRGEQVTSPQREAREILRPSRGG
jgi:hypothetical protein